MSTDRTELDALLDLLAGRRLAVLAGAGCSTESGIPDYRGPGAKPRRPIQHQEFVRDPRARQRYWARSLRGWPRLAAARPNAGHQALAALEAAGRVTTLITQNVDGLHQAAGSRAVIELHGALGRVCCLGCGAHSSRQALQARLLAANPGLSGEGGALDEAEAAPDGDAELEAATEGFVVPGCATCGGVLMPDVVFFGGSVPAARVAQARQAVEQAQALLVVGSSLSVFSGFRFVRYAAAAGVPVAIVNRGPTRGDPLATVKVDGALGQVLPALVVALARG
ncbi:NAD-dependent protein deacetylase [Myxococcota bacterium]|nr:NAD-dependent protein deacetylase [Myxococcota bacterium]